jgi:hypothetical protein
MKIKLTESQLENIVKKTIKEEESTSPDKSVGGKDAVLDFIFKQVRELMKGNKSETEDSEEPSKSELDSDNSYTSPSSSSDFKKMTELVIDKLEGGYYNPDWHYKSAMGRSGETMFGIDRKHGGSLNTSSAGIEFWNTIDKNKNKRIWKHYFRGGNLEQKLKDLVVKIMEPHFDNLFQKYLTPKSQKIVKKSNGLLFHFIYASWNGPGYFQKFAEAFNNEVDKGTTSIPELKKVAIQSRRNSSVSGSVNKIENIINNLS